MGLKIGKFVVFLAAALSFHHAGAESVIYPGASWEVDHVLWPGVRDFYDLGPIPLKQPVSAKGSIRVNEHMDRMFLKLPNDLMVFTRVCKDDVDPIPLPDVNMGSFSKDLTVWKVNYTNAGGTFNSVVYEQKGEGILTGPMTGTGPLLVIRAQYTLFPLDGIPRPPQDGPGDGPVPDTPKKAGVKAVAKKLAAELGQNPQSLEKYLSAAGTEQGALLVRIWLGANSEALPAEREVTDPCDPRYGNIKPAKWLYVFKIIKLEDAEGVHYFVTSQLVEVESGIVKKAFTPRTVDASFDLDREVSDAYEGLDHEIGAP